MITEYAIRGTDTKSGMSAKTLERVMGVSYHVAWHMLHRFRMAMVRSSREPLSGEVEVDETLIGGVDEGGKRGRGTNKAVVVIAVEIKRPKGSDEFVCVRFPTLPPKAFCRLFVQ